MSGSIRYRSDFRRCSSQEEDRDDTSKSKDSTSINNVDEDDWIDIDKKDVPAIGRTDEEPDWESVDVSSEFAKCSLDGEDDYALDSFKSSKAKSTMMAKLNKQIIDTKKQLQDMYRSTHGPHVKHVEDTLETLKLAKAELEATMVE